MLNPHADRYADFAALSRRERADRDFAITITERPSSVAIIAPHAGAIEPRTGEIARAIAGRDFSLYLFEGLKRTGNFEALHVTSCHFDEPGCLALLGRSAHVVAIHGCRGAEARVFIGGLDTALKAAVAAALLAAGIRAEVAGHDFPALQGENIVNRGTRAMGVQLEITRALRGGPLEMPLVGAVRSVLLPLDMPA